MMALTKKTIIDYSPDFQIGEIILLDKAVRKSSFDLVYKVRKAVGVQKVGHAGTLDPAATGLVIVCTGKKTKMISHVQELTKTYTGIITLGKTTLSHDCETEFVSENSFDHITEKEIFLARDVFIGNIIQKPPMYSAVKIHGQPLYKYARKGYDLERKTREIFVHSFEIKKIELPDIHFEICCSKGTYIRVIAHDFGQVLGCGAYLKILRRTQIGDYHVDDAFGIEEFKEYAKNIAVVLNTD
jgi:tRNA pseudouridine55 synthase